MSKRYNRFHFSLNIKNRLFLGLSILIIPLLIIMTMIIGRVNWVRDYADNLSNLLIPTMEPAIFLDIDIFAAQLAMLDYIITKDPRSKKDFKFFWNDINSGRGPLSKLLPLWPDPIYARKWEQLNRYYDSLYATQEQAFALTSESDNEIMRQLPSILAKLKSIYAPMIDVIDGVRSPATDLREPGGLFDLIFTKPFKIASVGLLQHVSTIRNITYVLVVSTILLAILIASWTARSISRPLNNAISIAKRIARGERNIQIAIDRTDETGELLEALAQMLSSINSYEENIKHNEEKTRIALNTIEKKAAVFSKHTNNLASGDLRKRLDIRDDATILNNLGKDLNSMTESLASITKQVTALSNAMISSLDEVKTAANEQSTGISKQASSLTEITLSIERIEQSSKDTGEKAKSLRQIAEKTHEKGRHSLESVNQGMLGMKSMQEKVQIIAQSIRDLNIQVQQAGEITALVNTLSQQSKMLALNASIEAAKAGESGKGFAVVAVEVKNLAEQSEKATVEVQKLLENIRHGAEKAVTVTDIGTKEVNHGMNLIGNANTSIHELTTLIQEADIASQHIEYSILQEGISIEQITRGMEEINEVTGSFLHGVQKTMQSIEILAEIAKKLKEQINIYRL